MDIKINSVLIKQYRQQKIWTQEQLSEVSGLSLRTIQRIESHGNASKESLSALAAVFEVDALELIANTEPYQPYLHKQIGTFSWVFYPTCIVLLLLINSEFWLMPWWVLLVPIAVLMVIAVMFSSMTVSVNEKEIRWWFGAGFYKKQLSIKEISTVKSVKNPWWMGFGIRVYGEGRLYNVSGLLGVELELNSGKFIRLGSDEPRHLLQAIERAQQLLE